MLQAAGDNGKPKILVIDDDPDVLGMLTASLAAEGYEVGAVSDSMQAYDAAAGTSPDVILLDMFMPYIGGWEVLRLFCLDEQLAKIPVIAITADRQADAAELARYGVAATIYKPIRLSELTDAIRRALR